MRQSTQAILGTEIGRRSVRDDVNHPKHYTAHPSGIECIQITEHMGFCLGNAIKYIWRADSKEDAIKDLRKALWYINREIQRRGGLTEREYLRKEIDRIDPNQHPADILEQVKSLL